MKNFLYNIFKESLLSNTGKVSSSRIISYIISFLIILFSITFISIEIVNMIISIKNNTIYTISSEIIIIFGALLSQQLTLLGINKYNEIKLIKTKNEKCIKTKNEEDINNQN